MNWLRNKLTSQPFCDKFRSNISGVFEGGTSTVKKVKPSQNKRRFLYFKG